MTCITITMNCKKKNVQTTVQLHSFHMPARLCSKSFKLGRLQQYVNQELPDVQAGFRKQRNQRYNCQHMLDHTKSKAIPKKSTFALLTTPKPLTVWITINWKILRDGNSRPPYLSPKKSVCR